MNTPSNNTVRNANTVVANRMGLMFKIARDAAEELNMENKNFEEWINLEGVEEERTYHFPSNASYTVKNPSKLFVKESGSHKLVDTEGQLHYIKKDWIAFSAKGQWKINIK